MRTHIDVVVAHPFTSEMAQVLEQAERIGEPVTLAFLEEGREEARRAVLVPAATLALWEHWAPAAYPMGEEGAGTERPEPAHPEKCGAFTLFRRRVGGRTAVARQGVVVAELLDPDEAHWLQEKARHVRQSFMDPRQRAAFEEFLARQPPPEEQRRVGSRSGRGR
ncbi:hypothetical protein [Nocardiopsis sp. ATB16-24]|uniref:hypothetical protein n=1 Tax=Nocardiopsis sp. ATB16-24 TaxID=3019555 RepID=UPI002557A60A|nr:hypothetical protein [Nocardiopsis sp. ATB16-24]